MHAIRNETPEMMNKNQLSYKKMVIKTLNIIEKNYDIWKDNKHIAETLKKIDALMKKISEKSSAQRETSKGYTKKKAEIRQYLNEHTELFYAIFRSYGAVTDNMGIVSEYSITITQLKMKRSIQVIAFVMRAIDYAKERINVLKDFGMTQDMISDLSAKLKEYNEVMSLPRLKQDYQSVATQNIKMLFKNLHELMSLHLDNLMMQYKFKEPQFYNTYKIARDIQDPQTIHKSLMGKVIDERNGKPLYYASIVVTYPGRKQPHKNKKHTSEKGLYQFPRLPEGKCTVTFTKPGFFALEKEVTISHTKLTKLNVSLVKDPDQPDYRQ